MKTVELIAALATAGAEPAPPRRPSHALAPAVAIGAVAAVVLVAVWLGVQPLSVAARASWFWIKVGYGLSMAAAGFVLAVSLARPQGRIRAAGLALAIAAAAAIWGAAVYVAMTSDGAPALWLGSSWKSCPIRIVVLALPILAGAALALRSLAPTQLRPAGAAAGLLAGGLSVVIYGLFCQETAVPFVALWYSLGILACVAIGAMAGPRLLRW
ncbi:MAG TPA: DUF1109 domain-containing protein [Caulobacteraceae bacterium]|jgi:hypothetical protein